MLVTTLSKLALSRKKQRVRKQSGTLLRYASTAVLLASRSVPDSKKALKEEIIHIQYGNNLNGFLSIISPFDI
jgi:hypothetical protein